MPLLTKYAFTASARACDSAALSAYLPPFGGRDVLGVRADLELDVLDLVVDDRRYGWPCAGCDTRCPRLHTTPL